MTDELVNRVERQLSAIITSGSGDVSERTLRQYGQRIVNAEDIEALIARVRELEAQAALDAKVFDVVAKAIMTWRAEGSGNTDLRYSMGGMKQRDVWSIDAALAARKQAD